MTTQRDPAPPVVLGSSLTGLLISWSLSRQGIAHVLIGGDEPPEVPRLGESLNECSGPDLWRDLGPEFQQLFVKKNHISLFNGRFASGIHIGNPRESLSRVGDCVVQDERIRLPRGRTLLTHVDRRRLDPMLYRRVIAEPSCRLIKTLVDEVGFDAETDRITHLALRDGSRIESPRYVFDGTGPRALVARAAGVTARTITDRQRVVWGHVTRAETPAGPAPWWECGTNLVRLSAAHDGVDGIAWIIPIRDVLSVGISVGSDDPVAERFDADALYRLLAQACARRGWDYRARFPDAEAPNELRHEYYTRDRAHGANWLLAGGAFQQIWFPTASGVWSTTLAAAVAPAVLGDPRGPAHKYEQTMKRLQCVHLHIEQLVHGPEFSRARDVYWFWSRWLSFVPRRLSDYFRIANDDFKQRRFLHSLFRRGTPIFQTLPRVQMALWANFNIRCRETTELDAQAAAFDGYFDTFRFRFTNYLQGLRPLIWPPIARFPQAWPMERLETGS